MRIIQLLPNLYKGDAIGNEAVSFYRFFTEMGVETAIYTDVFDAAIKDSGIEVRNLWDLPEMATEDILIYHCAVAWAPLSEILAKARCHKVMIYHNITPPEFFEPYDQVAFHACRQGLGQLVDNVNKFDCCLSDSKFSQLHLESIGARLPIRAMPLLIDFADFEQAPDEGVLAKYDDDRTNILFVGRVAPNKCQHDIIEAFARYKEEYDEGARLFLVGSAADRAYTAYVKERAEESGYGGDIIFPGHIPFSHILSYYRLADLFLCLSEHEGFCVPVLEAMKMKVPFLGYDACAVPETMGGAGVLIKEKDFGAIAELMHELMEDPERRRQIVKVQEQRLEDFAYEKIADEYRKFFLALMEGK